MNANEDRYRYWQAQHVARMKSGKSISEFCQGRGIKASTYRQAVVRYGFTEKGPKQSKPDFIELINRGSGDGCVLEIEYRGCQVRLYPGVDAGILRDTLEVLGGLR
jgi:hypothetical protein